MNFEGNLTCPVYSLKRKGSYPVNPTRLVPPVNILPSGQADTIFPEPNPQEMENCTLVKSVYFLKKYAKNFGVGCSDTNNWFLKGPNLPLVSSHSMPAGELPTLPWGSTTGGGTRSGSFPLNFDSTPWLWFRWFGPECRQGKIFISSGFPWNPPGRRCFNELERSKVPDCHSRIHLPSGLCQFHPANEYHIQ